MLKYWYDPQAVEISENRNEEDYEFRIRVLREEPHVRALKEIQKEYEDNRDHTDVLFYLYPDHEYRVIVRRDRYADFVLELMKRKVLLSVTWTE